MFPEETQETQGEPKRLDSAKNTFLIFGKLPLNLFELALLEFRFLHLQLRNEAMHCDCCVQLMLPLRAPYLPLLLAA